MKSMQLTLWMDLWYEASPMFQNPDKSWMIMKGNMYYLYE